MLALKSRSLDVCSVVVMQALGFGGLSSSLISVPLVLISVRCPKTMPLCTKTGLFSRLIISNSVVGRSPGSRALPGVGPGLVLLVGSISQ